MTSLILLWLALATHTKITVVNLSCESGRGLIVDNHGGIVSGVDVSGDITRGCLIYSDNEKVTNITINGYHYDKCGPTKNGMTPCIRINKVRKSRR